MNKNKGKFDVKCHASWLTADFIMNFAQVMKSHEKETIVSKRMKTCVRLACTDLNTKQVIAVFPNGDKNMRGKDEDKTNFSVCLKSFNEVLKTLGLNKYLNFHGNKGGTYDIILIDLEALDVELYGRKVGERKPMNIIEALADSVRKTSLIKIKASQSLPTIENEEKEEKEVENSEPPKLFQDSTVLPGVEPAVVKSVGTKARQKKKKEDDSITIIRKYSVKVLREAYYIGILVKYALKIGIKMDLTEIVNVLTNNYFLEFTSSFKNSQELKTRICSGKLSTIFSLASDNTLRYKPQGQGQGITSFAELEAKYRLANDIQVISLMVYDPHNEWRNTVNTSYIEEFSMRTFTDDTKVVGVQARWECTPSALWKAWEEFHRPIIGRYHYLGIPEVPLPFIKPETIPPVLSWGGLVTGQSNKELEKMRNTALLLMADLNAAA